MLWKFHFIVDIIVMIAMYVHDMITLIHDDNKLGVPALSYKCNYCISGL